jgi:outer membrane receptor protein involved in Fe transport
MKSLALLLGCAGLAGAQSLSPAPVALPPLAVTATRASQPLAQVPFSLVTVSGHELHSAPTATLDGALRRVPGFSLFRRSDSLTANPTAQGVSLRGLGPSGASRSLVLLDGVPLNDPFGGWVTWSKVPANRSSARNWFAAAAPPPGATPPSVASCNY